MNISKREMDAYHATLTRLQGRARSSLERLIQAGLKIKPDMDDAEFIELVNKSMVSVTLTYGDAAGSIALDFFDKTSGEHASNTDLANVPMFVNRSIESRLQSLPRITTSRLQSSWRCVATCLRAKYCNKQIGPQQTQVRVTD